MVFVPRSQAKVNRIGASPLHLPVMQLTLALGRAVPLMCGRLRLKTACKSGPPLSRIAVCRLA
jgi:hypothetical protein